MKQIKKTGIAAVLVLAMVALAACGGKKSGSAVEAIQKAGKITMVTNAEFPPFEYKDGDEIIGIDVDISKAIAEELGVELEITDIAFDSCIPSVTEGRADFVCAGMTITEDRLKSVDFTDNYFNASQVIIVANDSDIASGADLAGKIVGVQQGTTGDIYVTDEDGENGVDVAEVKRYPKGMDAVSDLMAGRLDAVVIDNFPAQKLVANNEDSVKVLDEPLTEEQYAIAVAKDSDLTEKLNGVIKSLSDSGKLDEIVSKYIGE